MLGGRDSGGFSSYLGRYEKAAPCGSNMYQSNRRQALNK